MVRNAIPRTRQIRHSNMHLAVEMGCFEATINHNAIDFAKNRVAIYIFFGHAHPLFDHRFGNIVKNPSWWQGGHEV